MAAGALRTTLPLWLGPLAGVALAALGLLCGLPLIHQRRLLVEGRAVPGIVTKHEKTAKGTAAEFQFTLLNGATGTGKTGPSSKPITVGSSICVLYDSESPRRHAVYPLSLVRLV
jgi:hypothetical protein